MTRKTEWFRKYFPMSLIRVKDEIKIRYQVHFLFEVFTSNLQIQMDMQHSWNLDVYIQKSLTYGSFQSGSYLSFYNWLI